ncbi:MAG: tetratricopeptide repeat protein [Candidatus Polarisedimenticolia bacterium]
MDSLLRRLFLATVAGAALLAAPPCWAHRGIDEQIRDVTRLIEASPRDASLRLRRGELHRAEGDWKSAEADYEAARRLDPGLDAVDLALGSMLLESGRKPEAARAALDRFLAGRPGHTDALVARARVLVRLQEPAAAVKDYDDAIAGIQPPARPRPEHYLERADALASQGDGRLAEALAGLDEGLARLGQPITLQMRAIDFELRLKRHDAALARVDQILSRPGRRERWLMRRGEIQEAAGRTAEARASYEEALVAIDRLPEGRRNAPATRQLGDELRSALKRLPPTATSSVSPPASP